MNGSVSFNCVVSFSSSAIEPVCGAFASRSNPASLVTSTADSGMATKRLVSRTPLPPAAMAAVRTVLSSWLRVGRSGSGPPSGPVGAPSLPSEAEAGPAAGAGSRCAAACDTSVAAASAFWFRVSSTRRIVRTDPVRCSSVTTSGAIAPAWTASAREANLGADCAWLRVVDMLSPKARITIAEATVNRTRAPDCRFRTTRTPIG